MSRALEYLMMRPVNDESGSWEETDELRIFRPVRPVCSARDTRGHRPYRKEFIFPTLLLRTDIKSG